MREGQGGLSELAGLEAWSEERLVGLASSVLYVRPLKPYPGWQFDADWDNPDSSFVLRRRIWEAFRDRGLDSVVEIEWHGGARIGLHVRNEFGKQIFVGGAIDPNEFCFLDRLLRKGMTFADVGANEGLYTVFAARRVGSEGRVLAFEPSRRERARLLRNLERNGLTNVELIACALAERDGEARLFVAHEEHSGHNTLGRFVYRDVELEEEEVVPVHSLDSAAAERGLERVDVVKVDIEGAEEAFLSGARRTLTVMRPVMLLELTDLSLRAQNSSAGEVLGHLGAMNYRILVFDPRTGAPAPAENLRRNWDENVIAWPAERPVPDSLLAPAASTGRQAGR
jgi:FkbM family methyltransferase